MTSRMPAFRNIVIFLSMLRLRDLCVSLATAQANGLKSRRSWHPDDLALVSFAFVPSRWSPDLVLSGSDMLEAPSWARQGELADKDGQL